MSYPMSYEEYEKKVIDLFLTTGSPEIEKKKEFLEGLKQNNDPLIRGLYNDTCAYYDSDKLNNEHSFDDECLMMTPVNVLESIY